MSNKTSSLESIMMDYSSIAQNKKMIIKNKIETYKDYVSNTNYFLFFVFFIGLITNHVWISYKELVIGLVVISYLTTQFMLFKNILKLKNSMKDNNVEKDIFLSGRDIQNVIKSRNFGQEQLYLIGKSIRKKSMSLKELNDIYESFVKQQYELIELENFETDAVKGNVFDLNEAIHIQNVSIYKRLLKDKGIKIAS